MKKIITFLCALFTLSTLTYSSVAHSFTIESSQNAAHSLSKMSSEIGLIALEDESQWSVSESDIAVYSKWNLGDSIFIIPKSSFFSSYAYTLHNTAKKTSVAANLYYGPKINGAFTKQVSELDLSNGDLTLSDGSSWLVAARSEKNFQNWQTSDYVIIGSSKYENHNILINVNLNQYIESTKYN